MTQLKVFLLAEISLCNFYKSTLWKRPWLSPLFAQKVVLNTLFLFSIHLLPVRPSVSVQKEVLSPETPNLQQTQSYKDLKYS